MASPEQEQLTIRVGELQAKLKLVDVQFDQFSPSENEKGERPAYRLGLSVGEANTDLSWVEALLYAIGVGDISSRIAMRIWDLKDQASRNSKE